MRLFLIGYMGSGKSTLAKTLAHQLNFNLIDTDTYIENQEKESISQIFKNRGEEAFRFLEQNIISKIENEDNAVVATGGGLPCFGDNMSTINKSGTSFYLCLNPKQLVNRLFEEKNDRPLISHFSSKDDLHLFVNKQLQSREKYYFQSDFILDGNQMVEDLVSDIVEFIT